MLARFQQLPASIRDLARHVRLPGVRPGHEIPALAIHPDWRTPAPTVLWLHGRTANKELDPGRYARWVKGGGGSAVAGGLAAVAIDLPGHGERVEAEGDLSGLSPDEMIPRALPEVDAALQGLWRIEPAGVFDLSRAAIGGMSLGGMIALRRLCEPHEFICAAVEGTCGDLVRLYRERERPERFASVSAAEHLEGFRPIPLLALHSESDRIVSWEAQRAFLDRLREHYAARGADPALVDVRTWASTGAPEEHLGFGRVSNDAKNAQTEFLHKHLLRSANP